MKTMPKFKLTDKQISFLDNHVSERWAMNEHGTIDVIGDFYYDGYWVGHERAKDIEDGKLPVKFNHITGNFSMRGMLFRTLEGCPESIGGHFQCIATSIANLIGGPSHVGDDYQVSNNKLISLEGIPSIINETLSINENLLSVIDYFPTLVKGYCGINNNKLVNIDKMADCVFLGSISLGYNQLTNIDSLPSTINGYLNVEANRIHELTEKSPKTIKGNFYIESNLLENLHFVPSYIEGSAFIMNNVIWDLTNHNFLYIHSSLDLSNNPITKGGFSLLKIKEIKNICLGRDSGEEFKYNVVSDILRDALDKKSRREGMLQAQIRLIEEELERFLDV